MEKLNLTILNGTLLSREEHKDEKFYLITDGFSPLALRSLDGITKFILNPTKLMDNDVYLFNKY